MNYHVAKRRNIAPVDAGMSLDEFVRACLSRGMAGIEKLSGIPGSVGGAIVGNAGAYGQTISDRLLSVEVYNDGYRTFTKEECRFRYRESIFKHSDGAILRARFLFTVDDREKLEAERARILALREKKYAPHLKCPGSFFKNLLVENIPASVLEEIRTTRDFYGKLPAWVLLDAVGARGMRIGDIGVTDFHGNLIVNYGHGTFADVRALARQLKERVKEKFGIELEEEVRYIE